MQISAYIGTNASPSHLDVDTVPDLCPVCKVKVDAALRTAYLSNQSITNVLQVVFQCPGLTCKSYFVAIYTKTLGEDPQFTLRRTFPRTFVAAVHDTEIEKLSARYVAVYNQASEAESMKLTEVAGMGYRKSLEVLVKDFALKEHPPSEHNSIKKTFLGPCIKQYLASHPDLVDMATRAAWLGNDESHYERRWVDKDLTDLKLCIELAVGEILRVIRIRKIRQGMPGPK